MACVGRATLAQNFELGKTEYAVDLADGTSNTVYRPIVPVANLLSGNIGAEFQIVGDSVQKERPLPSDATADDEPKKYCLTKSGFNLFAGPSVGGLARFIQVENAPTEENASFNADELRSLRTTSRNELGLGLQLTGEFKNDNQWNFGARLAYQRRFEFYPDKNNWVSLDNYYNLGNAKSPQVHRFSYDIRFGKDSENGPFGWRGFLGGAASFVRASEPMKEKQLNSVDGNIPEGWNDSAQGIIKQELDDISSGIPFWVSPTDTAIENGGYNLHRITIGFEGVIRF